MNPARFLRPLVAVSLSSCLSVACGGSFVPSDGDGAGGTASDAGSGGGSADEGTGGAATGTGGVPGAGGTPGTGGAGTGGEPTMCCEAAAVCNEGDLEVESEEDCPIGGECYSNSICCSTVWCMKAQALCDAIPRCVEGETEVPECPVGSTCVKRALCGTVITCAQDGVVCDLEPEPNRHYVANSALECVAIDFSCPEHTTGFSDACGCGCEQPDTCPATIDCQPGSEVDPLCSSEECPYSTRAL